MTEIDARKAARQEAERVSETTEDATKGGLEWEWGFEDGGQWAVEQLPSRDEIADTLDFHSGRTTGGSCCGLTGNDRAVMTLHQADAVLALIRSRYEEEK